MKLKIEMMKTADLVPYANNAKIHTEEQIDEIKKSIIEFGMNDPVAIWKNNEIIEGHGRLIACMELGIEEIPVIRLDHLTDEQRRAYMLVHNQLTMNTGYEWGLLEEEVENIHEVDMSEFGFDSTDFDISDDDFSDDIPDDEHESTGEKKEKDEVKKVTCPYCGEEVELW